MFHTKQHNFHWGKKPTWTYTHIHTYGTHTSICEPSETPTENSSEKTQRRRRTMVDLKALAE
jgi:predicted FMN-binding regulatory protein PaiB